MITLNKKLIDEIVSQCLKELPNEACGILAGKERTIAKVYQMTNASKSPIRFFMEAKEQLNVMKEMRALGLEMLGIYHSHVASRAYPSAHDVEMAFYTDVSYVIISLADRENPVIKSFIIENGKILEEELKITI